MLDSEVYIISLCPDQRALPIQYLTRGEWSEFGLTTDPRKAVEYRTVDDALKVIRESREINRRSLWHDGSSSPPPVIHTGLSISNSNPCSSGQLQVIKVVTKVERVWDTPVDEKSGYMPEPIDY